jgi:hypothetical protein
VWLLVLDAPDENWLAGRDGCLLNITFSTPFPKHHSRTLFAKHGIVACGSHEKQEWERQEKAGTGQ